MILQSFTEPHRLINFDKDSHVYTDLHTGKKLISSTTHIKQYKVPFKAKEIAEKCATIYRWGVDKSSILALWENNGKITSAMGDAIHEALELYTNFRQLGKVIQDNKNKPANVALPKHPILKKILTEFDAVDIYFDDYDVMTEVLITSGDSCALVDRLYVNAKEKKVRIGDYKINTDAKKIGGQQYCGRFKDLPSNKVSSYQLQMSFHAAIFKRFGYEVEGIHAFVLDEGWEKLDLDILEDVIDLG